MISAVDRNLLIRIARRMEEQADASYRVAITPASADLKAIEQAKRKRDRELGDAKDLREYVKRAEAA